MKYFLSLILVLILTVPALAVDIIVQFPIENATVAEDGTIDWKPAILAAIAEVQALNEAIPALQADPIPVNPDAEQIENMMGDVMSPPNEFGYSTVRIDGWRKLIMPRGVAPTTFSLVFGQPVEDVQVGEDENGNPIYVQVYGGTIAE